MSPVSAATAIGTMRSLLRGDPVFLAGSLVAADVYGLPHAYSDVDLFCPTGNVLIATGQKLMAAGYTLDDRMERAWYRWLRFGFKTWHTNSLRLTSPIGEEINVIYKLTEGHATTSLAQVIESFDFGLLGVGWELEHDTFRDMRSYLFPQYGTHHGARVGPLPMMPNKADSWAGGFISQYNGLREIGRYAKYIGYGYDLSLVKDQLVTGYRMADLYLSNHFDKDKQQLGLIYRAIADHIEYDHIDELRLAAKTIDYKDSLDVIMEALE